MTRKTAYTHFYACAAIIATVCAATTASIVTTFGHSDQSGWLPRAMDALATMPHAELVIALAIGGLLLAGVADSWRRDMTKTTA